MYVWRKDSAAEMDTGFIHKREEQEQTAEEIKEAVLLIKTIEWMKEV